MFSARLLCAFVVVLFASGCASITSDSHQPISFSTTKDGQVVEKVKCSLNNDRGHWEVETPGVVAVRRSAEDLIVTCKKADLPDGIARGISRTAAGMWGNILFGGAVGAVIDHTSGKGYNYPNDIPVKMGESTTYDRATEGKPGTSGPAASGAEQQATIPITTAAK